jgi:hypothetical protein
LAGGRHGVDNRPPARLEPDRDQGQQRGVAETARDTRRVVQRAQQLERRLVRRCHHAGEYQRDRLGAEDRRADTDRRRDAQQRPVPLRSLQDAAAARPQPDQEGAREPQGPQEGDEKSYRCPLHDHGAQVWREHRHVRRLAADGEGGVARQGEEYEERDGRQEKPAVLPAHHPRAQEQQHAVRRQDVTDVEQQRVQEAHEHEHEAAPPQQPAYGPGPRRLLPTGDPRDAVPEQQPEHRERPAVDEGREQPDHDRVGAGTALWVAAEHR